MLDKLKQLEEENKRLIDNINGMREGYYNLENTASSLDMELAEARKLIEDLQERLNRSRQECNRLKKTRDKLKTELKT